MVRIVLAGGAGNVGREILDGLVAKGTHELIVFTRSEASKLTLQGVTVVQVDYNDTANLTRHLQGVGAVLSFIVSHSDPEGTAQKNLIDASIAAGVRRFAPSEWGLRSNSGSPHYKSKDIVHEYLQEVNRDKKVLEYCLFQPGLFLNYFSLPYPSTTHVQLFNTPWDLQNRRVIAPADGDFPITLTTVQDLTRVVVEAIDYKDVWPERGGITGTTTTNFELLKLLQLIRGPFKIETVSRADLEAGKLNTSWIPQADHPAIPPEMRATVSESMTASLLLSALRGAFAVTDEWNQLLPHLQFTKAEDFLTDIWKDKM
ncbi:uncharacterized protein Z518_06596 [Rhinocladiella mackenziei CBS 650.93]|uniref:NmrA-like domain-containing protein n=1 Tax=Rhinocladiella mackenziei CBS 650.93 TaxID=1442369 RepID=A0A0D2IIE0_9EURO|nr:uncharacterized protein Z518_06596 [Rhinocladiella mackenziei CBS 650.93]KIX03046.1 hypothetical protein Z518_06596 [Rhinocladiella mackenziei CBS 650.93]